MTLILKIVLKFYDKGDNYNIENENGKNRDNY